MRVILAEDQVLLREGLARLFGDLGHEVTSALGDVTELESRISSDDPDLVVLDVRMPPTHTDEGVTAARAIKADRPELGVLLLSQHVETSSTADLLGRPAFGYLLKDRVLDVREFLDTCERVARGGSVLDPKVVAALLASRDASPLAHLSERERQVLALMAEGLSNTAIAERLVLSARTVEAHVGHLLGKLDIPDSQETNRRVLAVLAWLRDEH
ncbi:MAG TPA: response regulator transcription factor [Frankiaceae bacterium]|nr:response regulator transcription factor [Frankiaceae bacterium]